MVYCSPWQLRQVLARYLSQRPEQIRFCRGDRGKPALLDPRLASGELSQPLEFNLSHSGDVGLLGIAQAPVGVDVEQLRPLTDSLSMARRFFSVKEFNFLQSLHESQRSQAFCRHWSCKEAYVKATGEGLVDQLDRVAVALEPEVRWMALPQGDPQQWQLRCLAPTAQTVAAVVVQQAAPLQIRWCRSPRL
ncbi:MAG: 4'-phosphopantetheinyl transferase superfamily protein [Synechococcales cyanobacterium RM1_1_8]|nr:4'-phosphopantetheinyl transferase superfamily protein [Synechococcales cyanobacterium RM1_1_8]